MHVGAEILLRWRCGIGVGRVVGVVRAAGRGTTFEHPAWAMQCPEVCCGPRWAGRNGPERPDLWCPIPGKRAVFTFNFFLQNKFSQKLQRENKFQTERAGNRVLLKVPKKFQPTCCLNLAKVQTQMQVRLPVWTPRTQATLGESFVEYTTALRFDETFCLRVLGNTGKTEVLTTTVAAR